MKNSNKRAALTTECDFLPRRSFQPLLVGGALSLAGAAGLVAGFIVTFAALIGVLGPSAGSTELGLFGVAGFVLLVGGAFLYAGVRTLSRWGHLTFSDPGSSRSKALLGVLGVAFGLLVSMAGGAYLVVAGLMDPTGQQLSILGLHPLPVALGITLGGILMIRLGRRFVVASKSLRW